MNFKRLLCLVFIITLSNCRPSIVVIKGHAHNDYEHKTPLMDALKNGFTSVEADVYLIENELYVSHNYPEHLNPALTLEALYLKPLQDHILKNKGAVYKKYSGPFYLMIDIKSSAKPTYEKLKDILSNYVAMISTIQHGIEKKGPVTLCVSGNRPVDEILADEPKLAVLDGRPNELNKPIPASIMPVVSTNYFEVLSWRGDGDISLEDQNRLSLLVQNTHAQNKKLRLWAAPDHAVVWKFLLDHGIDLINTDHLEAFRAFALKYKPARN